MSENWVEFLFVRKMSLYVAADGILETHVTWQDIEEAMQASLGTKAKFGANKSLRNISDLKVSYSNFNKNQEQNFSGLSIENRIDRA